MARIRTIKPELFEDEALGQCSLAARYLFVGLISHSDDHGRQRGNPRLILANVFPYDADVDAEEVAGWLAELASAGVVQVYETGSQSFVQVVNWGKHQRVDKVKPTEFPDPPTSPEIPIGTGGRSDGAKDRAGGATEGNGRDQGMEGINVNVEFVTELFDEWRTVCGHERAKLDPKRHRSIIARLAEGRTREEFSEAFLGAHRAPAVNEAGVVFDDIELVCRNASKFESFMARVGVVPRRESPSDLLRALPGGAA